MDSIPPVHTVEDLPVAIQAATEDPSIRWYVVKKAASLKATDQIPAEWGVPLTASAGDPPSGEISAAEAALVASYYTAVEANADAIVAAERFFSEEVRQRYAKQGIALPDGSFPIPDRDALRRAVQAIGRASDYGRAKRHIIKRARALGATNMLPEDWSVTASADGDVAELSMQMMRLRMEQVLTGA